jgi:hypothetical protein
MPAAACCDSVLVATNRTPGSSQRGWPAHRLADRRGIRRVVLIAPHIGLRPRVRPLTVPMTGSSPRDQPRVMAELGDLARPVMRRRAPLHPDQAARHFGKERRNLPPAHRATQRHCPIASTPCTLKHGFGQIQPNRCNLLRGWLPSVGVVDNPILAHRCREGPSPHQACGQAIAVAEFVGNDDVLFGPQC